MQRAGGIIGCQLYAVNWWESSPNVSNATNFCNVNTNGTPNNNNASNAYGVLP